MLRMRYVRTIKQVPSQTYAKPITFSNHIGANFEIKNVTFNKATCHGNYQMGKSVSF